MSIAADTPPIPRVEPPSHAEVRARADHAAREGRFGEADNANAHRGIGQILLAHGDFRCPFRVEGETC